MQGIVTVNIDTTNVSVIPSSHSAFCSIMNKKWIILLLEIQYY